MGNIAGDVLQVMCPRAADDDGIVQREGTVWNSSSSVSVPLASFRTQPTILHYRPWRKQRQCVCTPQTKLRGGKPPASQVLKHKWPAASWSRDSSPQAVSFPDYKNDRKNNA
jgi:hypothetical protein